MKVMMIDPWGINNISMYTNGLCAGLSKYVDLTLYTNHYYEKSTNTNYKVKKVFFRISEKMNRGKIRNLIRGIEYINAYRNIIKELKKESYDVVHVQWLLLYKIDIYYLNKIKKYCNKLIYTAHNVIPHVNGEIFIQDLRKIYDLVDTVILHGEGIRNEFEAMFPEFKNKVVIQRHGTYLNQNTQVDIGDIDREIISKIEKYNKRFIFFGNMFYNKGVDRLAKIWIEKFNNKNQLLVIAGKKSEDYKELTDIEKEILLCDNILYINRYIEDNLLNYLITQSDLIILPYRHASMSGVIFTAAEFKKTVLCTNTGSIAEYLIDNENSFIVELDDEILFKKLKYISDEISNERLKEMGVKLNLHINKNYSWDNIAKKLVDECFEKI